MKRLSVTERFSRILDELEKDKYFEVERGVYNSLSKEAKEMFKKILGHLYELYKFPSQIEAQVKNLFKAVLHSTNRNETMEVFYKILNTYKDDRETLVPTLNFFYDLGYFDLDSGDPKHLSILFNFYDKWLKTPPTSADDQEKAEKITRYVASFEKETDSESYVAFVKTLIDKMSELKKAAKTSVILLLDDGETIKYGPKELIDSYFDVCERYEAYKEEQKIDSGLGQYF